MPYDPENPVTVANQVLLAAEKKSITATDTMQILDNVSRSYAMKVLEKLRNKGHLTREQKNIPETGGRYFEYEITKTGIKKCDWMRKQGVDLASEVVGDLKLITLPKISYRISLKGDTATMTYLMASPLPLEQ